jgi:uncharacterized SAM-binding protein YcdF (DUF218 family)
MKKKKIQHIYINLIILICIAIIVIDIISFGKSLKITTTSKDLPDVEGIAVFTGGENRVQTAIQLLSQNVGQRLFISGVHPNTKKSDISYQIKSDRKLLECCIDLGEDAHNTFENAFETIKWVKNNNFKSLVIVTSNYHMKRSLFILKQSEPKIKFIPFRVASTLLKNTKSSLKEKIRALIIEYLKYTYTRLYFLFQLN